jgi:hypothetical protein
MKKIFFAIVLTALFSLGITAQTKKDGTPDMRYKSNKETYSNPSTSNSRPVYSGQTHTESHGGTYQGSTNSHHKNGTYKNPRSNNNYGVHKTRK